MLAAAAGAEFDQSTWPEISRVRQAICRATTGAQPRDRLRYGTLEVHTVLVARALRDVYLAAAPVFRRKNILWPAALSAMWFALAACGGAGASGAGQSKTGGTGAGAAGADSESSGDGAPTGPTLPSCDDGTCFNCGDGLCPKGFYCDAQAAGGPACSWLPECAESPSCTCLEKVLGSDCRCAEKNGGVFCE